MKRANWGAVLFCIVAIGVLVGIIWLAVWSIEQDRLQSVATCLRLKNGGIETHLLGNACYAKIGGEWALHLRAQR